MKEKKERKKIKKDKLKLFKVEQSFKKRKKIKLFKLKKFKIKKINLGYYYATIILISIFVIIILILGPTFKIKNNSIYIEKIDPVSNINLAYKALEDIRGDSIFKIDKKYIKNKIQDYQGSINYVKTNIVLPNTIKIKIGTNTPLYNTMINDKKYIITLDGFLIPSKDFSELRNIEVLHMESNNTKVLSYKKIFKEKYIKNIFDIEEKIKNNFINLKIEKIKYYETEREVHFVIKGGLILVFDLTWDYKPQVENMAIFNKERVDLSKNTIHYLDLRIKGKAFYCEKSVKNMCHFNEIYN